MLSRILLSAALAAAGLGSCSVIVLGERQAADEASFDAAADALISSYIPQPIWVVITSTIAVAASSAGVTGDPASLAYSALKATSKPEWFISAIPSPYSEPINSLEAAIDSLRPEYVPGGDGPPPTVVEISTTIDGTPTVVIVTETPASSDDAKDDGGPGGPDSTSSTSNVGVSPTAFVGGGAAGVMALIGLVVAL